LEQGCYFGFDVLHFASVDLAFLPGLTRTPIQVFDLIGVGCARAVNPFF
jgi:hypothetical protein